MTSERKQKVICLGLGRTGTWSLMKALEILGFGPCYHMTTVVNELGGKDFPTWHKVALGEATSEDIDSVLHNYGAVLDYPPAMYCAEMYATYPDAKFILTTRDPAKWEKSMKATILRTPDLIRNIPDNERPPAQDALMKWCYTDMQQLYHRGRIYTHTQQEFIDHNERVKKTIPPEELLIYEVGEGWERLVEFLGVPMPTVPFPHVNDTESYQDLLKRRFPNQLLKEGSSEYPVKAISGQ